MEEAGVHIVPEASAVVFVDATVLTERVPACFVHLHARLLEDARLERNGLRVEASSWDAGGLVSAASRDCSPGVIETIGRVVDDFVETYGAMNPQVPSRMR